MKFLLDFFLSSRKGLCAFLFLGVLLVVLTRMPQWTSPHLDLDGDEAILGLMAKHVYEGKAFPLFFYGQNYGLSFIETLAAASFFFCFGVSTISLKASMLFLWCLGWIFFVLALDIFSNRKYAFFLSLFLIFCPAWNLWSMMARGGYITAFALFSLCLWMLGLVYRKKGNALFLGLCLGFSMGLLLLAQPLFFLAILPWTFLLFSQKFFFYANALASFSSIFVLVYF